jgi:ketosteroid isomerase-like protein
MATVSYEVAAETELKQATEAFYQAVGNMFKGDLKPMERLWSRTPEITLLTPFGGRLEGWNEVRSQLAQMSKSGLQGRIEPREILIRVLGDVGYSVSRLYGENLTVGDKTFTCDHRATLIFRREGDQWKVVHHHVDYDEKMAQLRP